MLPKTIKGKISSCLISLQLSFILSCQLGSKVNLYLPRPCFMTFYKVIKHSPFQCHRLHHKHFDCIFLLFLFSRLQTCWHLKLEIEEITNICQNFILFFSPQIRSILAGLIAATENYDGQREMIMDNSPSYSIYMSHFCYNSIPLQIHIHVYNI